MAVSSRARRAAAAAVIVALVHTPVRAQECLRGVNLAGAEFGEDRGSVFTDYVYPSPATLDYFAARGFNAIRLPFSWPRLQPRLGGPLEEAELALIRATVASARARGMRTVLDPHGYARYRGAVIGSADVPVAAFADFWGRVATAFSDEPDVLFGLMNEPHDIDILVWRDAAVAALGAIRATGSRHVVLVPGTAWTGAHSWQSDVGGGSNASVIGAIRDGGPIAFEVHQYMDANASGTSAGCDGAAKAVEALRRFTDWLRATGSRGFLGEFGAPPAAECQAALAMMVRTVNDAPDVWAGWTYWAGGEWWPPDYPMSIQPVDGRDRPQMATLAPHVPRTTAASAACPALR